MVNGISLIIIRKVKELFESLSNRDSSQIFNFIATVTFFLFPERKILLEKFDNGFGISEGLFVTLVDLVKSALKCGLT